MVLSNSSISTLTSSQGCRKVVSYTQGISRTGHGEPRFWYAPQPHAIYTPSRVAVCTIDGPQSEDLLRPVFMGCATKNAKVVAISLGSLHRLISLKAVPLSAVPVIINIMGDCIHQGVDIQLRILQTLLSLITNFPSVHGELLGDVCHFDNACIQKFTWACFTGSTSMFQTPGVSDRGGVLHRCRHTQTARHVCS